MKKHFFMACMICMSLVSCKKDIPKENLYQEKYRPQVHFSTSTGWMNDPNGMVYHDGEYHLFYQHFPDTTQWGPMHWGHAVSTDLIHWEHLPIAIYPDSLGYIFSGSAVVDKKNTSGLGTSDNPPLLAFFTYHDPIKAKNKETDVESQALAYSVDKGRTWIKYKDNPIIDNVGIRDFRDPKVIWNDQYQKWVMSLASGQVIKFFLSENAIDWTYSGEFGEGKGAHTGVWECPDLFPLQVNGEEKWVLLVSLGGGPAGSPATQYFIGDFDGNQFVSDQESMLWIDYGSDCYAGVTWSNTPDQRCIFISWMNSWEYAGQEPCSVWSGALGFPRELKLVKKEDTYLLTSLPIAEINSMVADKKEFNQIAIDETFQLSGTCSFPMILTIDFDNSRQSSIDFPERYGVRLKNKLGEYILIGYNSMDQCFFIDRSYAGWDFLKKHSGVHMAPYIVSSSQTSMQLIIDHSSVELFAAEGLVSMTDVFYPTEAFDSIELFSENGKAKADRVVVSQLKSIW